MKKILILLFLQLGVLLNLSAQEVVWERTYGWPHEDILFSVENTEGGYMALGSVLVRGTFFGPYIFPEAVIIKLDYNGDTIFVKNLGSWVRNGSGICAMKKCRDGNFLAALSAADTVLNFNTLRLMKITPSGQVRWQIDFPNTVNWLANDICVLPDGGCLITGGKDSQTGGLEDGYALRLDSNGTELWRQFFNPSILTYVRHAEVLNGTSNSFLISGNAGARIWAAWLDSNGVVHKQHIYWQDLANTQLSSAGLKQAPGGNVVAWGSNSNYPNNQWYLGRFDTTDANIWERIQYGNCINPYVNTEGKVMLDVYNSSGINFRKYSVNGTILDTLVLSNNLTHPRGFNSAAWSNSDSAVFAGTVDTDNNNYRSDFYFVKMAGVGNGYVSAVPRLVSEEAVRVSLYPNPAATSFRIGGLRVPQSVQLYNLNGQKVYELTAMPDTDIDVQGLPPGLYIVRLQADGVNMGTKKLVVIK